MARNRSREDPDRKDGAGADPGAAPAAPAAEPAQPEAGGGGVEYEPRLVRLYHPAFHGEPRTGVVTGMRPGGRWSCHVFFRPDERDAPSPRDFADIPIYGPEQEPTEPVYARVAGG